MNAREAEQTYTLAEVSRLLHVPTKRINELVAANEMPPPALQIPGGGHKGRRWLASQLQEVFARWDVGSIVAGTR